MKIIELIIDETDEYSGVDAISLVEYPAIEENWVALNKNNKEYKFKSVDDDKRILMGALLVPNKMIYRKDGDEEYYIHFTKETVKKASELYLMRGNTNNATYEHIKEVEGVSLVESWIVEDKEKDKSNLYDLDLPVGTWVGAVKVNNEMLWKMAKEEGTIRGFSIEGFFAEKAQRPKEPIAENLDELEELSAAKKLLEIKQALIEMQLKKKTELESYNDYPQGAVNNAKRALEWVEKNGWGSCGEATGKKRASQIAAKEKLTRDTIARMASFKRHQQHKDVPYSEGCGGLMWDAWGGSAGINWAINKLKELDNE